MELFRDTWELKHIDEPSQQQVPSSGHEDPTQVAYTDKQYQQGVPSNEHEALKSQPRVSKVGI